jgi:hypothetical protein
MKFVEPIGLNRKFGAMGHPSSRRERWRILHGTPGQVGFNLERGTEGRLTIQTVARGDRGEA